jgi:alkaline phosphatase
MEVNAGRTDKIFGLFASSHIEYKMLRNTETDPSLMEMTMKALEILKKNENGFVLLVEGGRIDHAHHATQTRLSLEETLEFEEAVDFVRRETNEEDTLIVVTADHGHVFTVGGYPVRRLMKFRS